ncbi:unnamed protein product [Allacma fusca]|uniref:Uncharacterized protein n=1 Tax=Allacma fusca TaxID=39272 RepID=A0A8J2NQD2_9HEXA|nr:unnamed protein product [Allacma fusca]
MELKTSIFLVLTLYILTLALQVTSRPHGGYQSHRHHSSHHQHHHTPSRHRNYNDNDSSSSSSDNNNNNNEELESLGPDTLPEASASVKMRAKSWHHTSEDDDDYDDDEGGRHAYLMTTNNKETETRDEDSAINSAFEKHMRPHHHHQSSHSHPEVTNNNDNSKPLEQLPEHDVYAYQLPSNLWFIVRYAKDSEGHIEKYMNIVASFTNYLDKLTEGVRTVSVNVKGVETVFRLTAKHKPYQAQSGSSPSSES